MLHDFSMALNNSKQHLYFRLPSKYLKGLRLNPIWHIALAESMRISHRTLLDYVIPIQGQECTPQNSDFLTNSRQKYKHD